MKTIKAYKLVRVRKNGTLGPLFINQRQVIPIGKWLKAEFFPTKGYSPRKGWHVAANPVAPHLSTKGRQWYEVEIREYEELQRPEKQRGLWYIAQQMKVIGPYKTLKEKAQEIISNLKNDQGKALEELCLLYTPTMRQLAKKYYYVCNDENDTFSELTYTLVRACNNYYSTKKSHMRKTTLFHTYLLTAFLGTIRKKSIRSYPPKETNMISMEIEGSDVMVAEI